MEILEESSDSPSFIEIFLESLGIQNISIDYWIWDYKSFNMEHGILFTFRDFSDMFYITWEFLRILCDNSLATDQFPALELLGNSHWNTPFPVKFLFSFCSPFRILMGNPISYFISFNCYVVESSSNKDIRNCSSKWLDYRPKNQSCYRDERYRFRMIRPYRWNLYLKRSHDFILKTYNKNGV